MDKGTVSSLINIGRTALKSEKFAPSGPTFWATHSDWKTCLRCSGESKYSSVTPSLNAHGGWTFGTFCVGSA